MFFPYDHSSVRATGRWAKQNESYMSTAAGSKLEIAFSGELITLHFSLSDNEQPYPHLWLSLDNGPLFESTLDHFIRVGCEDGMHILTVVLKSFPETPRWFANVVSKVQFLGYDADACAVLPESDKKTIEFIGDSITEGMIIDEYYRPNKTGDGKANRPYQDDALATYAAIAAKRLGLEPVFCGYGGVGTTRSGCGEVPAAPKMYPFCFDGAPITHKPCDFIVINHGTNDRVNPDKFSACYRELLEVVYKHNPNAEIIAMVPFISAFRDEIFETVEQFNLAHNTDVFVVDASDWVPREPLHPNRESHKLAGEKLADVLSRKYGLNG